MTVCRQCYTASVLFTWHMPELWRRFTIALRRLVAKALRGGGEDPAGVRVSFVKVVEMERRVVPLVALFLHIHHGCRAPEALGACGKVDESKRQPAQADHQGESG